MGAARQAVNTATSRDGLAVAYLMGVVNAALVTLTAFGIALSAEQTAAVVALANALLVAAFHLTHLIRRGKSSSSTAERVTRYTHRGGSR